MIRTYFGSFIVGVLSNLATHVVLRILSSDKTKGLKSDKSLPLRGWFEVFGWSLLPVLLTVPALTRVQNRWPLPLSRATGMLGAIFLISIGVMGIMKYVSLKESPKLVVAIWIIVGLGSFSGYSLLDRSLPNFIAMDCAGHVVSNTTLQGRIIDPRWRVYVLIRPRSTLGTFPCAASPPGTDGTWYATCDFGGGEGEVYEVSALALPPDLALSIKEPLPNPEWLEVHAPYKTSICVVTKRESTEDKIRGSGLVGRFFVHSTSSEVIRR